MSVPCAAAVVPTCTGSLPASLQKHTPVVPLSSSHTCAQSKQASPLPASSSSHTSVTGYTSRQPTLCVACLSGALSRATSWSSSWSCILWQHLFTTLSPCHHLHTCVFTSTFFIPSHTVFWLMSGSMEGKLAACVVACTYVFKQRSQHSQQHACLVTVTRGCLGRGGLSPWCSRVCLLPCFPGWFVLPACGRCALLGLSIAVWSHPCQPASW